MTWLLDTLAWTGILITLVLVARRPVTKYLGPQAAYALWIIPFARLVLPPFVLPAWLKPYVAADAAPIADASAPLAAPIPIAGSLEPVVVMAEPAQTPSTVLLDALPFIVLAIWAIGASLFLYLRFRAYFQMRRTLLANAIKVGEVEGVRLLETPLTEAPIAFGVRDRVIALPEGFLDWTDPARRDFALEHEMAHHKGGDLWANFMVQPLFAIHWFNPLAWMGWRALRCDQEAACDARVVSSRSRQARADYAAVIAGFATGPRLALAAPMACPVLGDKSIIHRLRSLKMDEITNRRRIAGRIGLAAALVALPLTATVTYAETATPPAPPAVPAPPAPPAPPVPPSPPAPIASVQSVTDVDEPKTVEEEIDEALAPDGTRAVRKHKWVMKGDEKMTAEERAELRAELAEAMKEMHKDLAEARKERKLAMLELKDELGDMTMVEVSCADGDPMTEQVTKNGKKVFRICRTSINAHARHGLEQARNEIATNKDMDDEIRAEVLRSLDEEIARLKSDS